MEVKDPVVAYVAEGNLEAHAIVDWLMSNGVDAHAVEDNFGGKFVGVRKDQPVPQTEGMD